MVACDVSCSGAEICRDLVLDTAPPRDEVT